MSIATPAAKPIEALHDGEVADPIALCDDDRQYRRAVVETLVACVQVTLALNDRVRMSFTADQQNELRRQLKNLPTKVLEKRLFAVQVQNPGVLMEAMKIAGYDVKVSRDGDINIDYKAGGTDLIGTPVTPELLEAL